MPLAFLPVHKLALGLATGLVAGAALFLLTAYHLLLRPSHAPDLRLLAEYFHGYTVSWTGALVGAL